MDKRIILLNGPSSSGKSTLAKALQALLQERNNERFEIVSIDDLLEMSPDEAIYEDDVFEINGMLCGRMLDALAAGRGVIVDHVITSRRIYDAFLSACGAYPLQKVLISCPVEVLRERELSRGDRHPGSAEASLEYLYPEEGYDLAVDTNAMTTEECAGHILAEAEQPYRTGAGDLRTAR